MHRIHNQPRMPGGPETTGKTIHWASQYDFYTGLAGLGVNGANSRMVVKLAGIKAGDAVLDVGCGTGNLTMAAGKGAGPSGSAYGIDASPEMVDFAQTKAARIGSKAIFKLDLVEKLSFPSATFDVVISRLVIHHLPDDLKSKGFAEILRVLKPGGLFLFVDFNQPSNPILNHVASAVIGHGMMQTSVWGYPPLLKETGFVEVAAGPTRSAFLAFVSGRKPL